MATIDFFPRKKTWSCTRQGIPLRPPSPKKRILFTGALVYIVTLVPGMQMFRMLRPSVLMWLEGHTFVGSLGAGRKLYQGNENTINNYFNVS